MTLITKENLIALGVFSRPAGTFVEYLNETMEKYQINTPLRIRHFLAQVLHESAKLYYTKELASGQAYEGRKDLGNLLPGDGVKFKGRGLIQITGRFNYEKLSKEFGVDFIKFPELLELPKHATLSAGWFWNKNELNTYADKDDVKTITKKINGGYNGLEDRTAILAATKSIITA
jgi:putative chitinase